MRSVVRRAAIHVILVLTGVLACDAPVDPQWPHEPSGYTVISDMPFTAAFPAGSSDQPYTDGWGITGYNRPQMLVTRVSDATAPLSSPWVAQFSYPIGYTDGTEPGDIYRTLDASSLYAGFWWKPSNPWQSNSSGTNKICFINVGPSMLLSMHPDGASWRLQFQNYYNVNANINLDPNVTTTHITLGAWHHIEILALSGGTIKVWIDGVLNISYGGQAMPASFSQFELAPTWGGNTGESKTEQDYYWYDDVHLSVP